jgi:hypothetical protein
MCAFQVGAIPVSERTVIEAGVEKQLRSQCPTATPSAGSAGTASLRESQASESELRYLAVLRIEDVFLAQLHYRAVLLNTGFQNAVLQVFVITAYCTRVGGRVHAYECLHACERVSHVCLYLYTLVECLTTTTLRIAPRHSILPAHSTFLSLRVGPRRRQTGTPSDQQRQAMLPSPNSTSTSPIGAVGGIGTAAKQALSAIRPLRSLQHTSTTTKLRRTMSTTP